MTMYKDYNPETIWLADKLIHHAVDGKNLQIKKIVLKSVLTFIKFVVPNLEIGLT